MNVCRIAKTALIGATLVALTQVFTQANAQGLAIGCSLSLPPDLGGACDYLANQMAEKRLSLRFGKQGEAASFGIDETGLVKIKGIVLALNGQAFTPAPAVYEFRVQDVTFLNYDYSRVQIDCKVGRCMKIRIGVNADDVIGTVLIVENEIATRVGVHKSFIKLKNWFCANDSC